MTCYLISDLLMLIGDSPFLSQDDELQVKVNKLSSTKTQLPYDYYFLDYCKPLKIMNSAENLGEVLRGDRIENSIYTVSTFNFFLMTKLILHQLVFL